MRPTAVEIVNVSKKYRISSVNSRRTSSKEVLSSLMMKPVNRLKAAIRGRALDTDVDFWPLKDVSFNIYQGETVGIIGPNGSGKSTLLRIIANITSPTKGYVRTRGRVATLLEIGSGFNPELSGRDNVMVNAVVLGMSEADVKKNFDSILDFAEIHEFIDTPIKRYSSGMMVRLAFSVAVHLDPEILIIDEVLAVGDISFIQKSFAKVKEIANSGTTVILVSHMAGFITELCDRAVWLDKGRIVESGDVQIVAANYLKAMLPPPALSETVVVGDTSTPTTTNVSIDPVEESVLGIKVSLIEAVRRDVASLYKNSAFAIINLDKHIVTVADPLLELTNESITSFTGLPVASSIPDPQLIAGIDIAIAEKRVARTRICAFGKTFFGIVHPVYDNGLDAVGELKGVSIAFFPEIPSVKTPIDTTKRLQIRQAELIMSDMPDKQSDVLVRFTYDVRESLSNYIFDINVRNFAGVDVFYTNDEYLQIPGKRDIGTHTMTLALPGKILSAGYYKISCGFWCPETRKVEDSVRDLVTFVIPERDGRIEKLGIEWPSLLYLPDQWTQKVDELVGTS